MNIQEIDKWLDNEYGCSYTRLEELHDFVVEQDLKHREEADKEIERLKNIIKEVREYIEIIVKNTPSSTRKDYANMLLIDYKKVIDILDKGE